MPFKSMVASIGTGLVNNALSQENAHVQREWQEKMWKMQNAYNHPAAMADRMRSAGLNPYLMQGAEPAGSIGTGATAQTIPLDNPLAYAKTFAEIDNLTASTNKTETETEKILKDISMLDLMYERGLIEKSEYEFKVKKYFEAWEQRNPFTLEADNLEADTGLKKEQTETENAKQSNLSADTGLKEAQTATEGAKQSNLSADTSLKNAQKVLTDVQVVTEQFKQANLNADTALKTQQSRTEFLKQQSLILENTLTRYFGPVEHWADLKYLQAQYDKLVAETSKIEADEVYLELNYELEKLKLEYQDNWVDKQIESNEEIAMIGNVFNLLGNIAKILGR